MKMKRFPIQNRNKPGRYDETARKAILLYYKAPKKVVSECGFTAAVIYTILRKLAGKDKTVKLFYYDLFKYTPFSSKCTLQIGIQKLIDAGYIVKKTYFEPGHKGRIMEFRILK